MRPAATLLSSRSMVPARSIASLFARWRSRVFPSRPTDPRQRLGLWGEKIAARFLRKHGYKVLFRRFRSRGGGEVDLICRHGKTLVFAEVKTRTGPGSGRPGDAVDLDKQRLIARGAHAWLRLLPEREVVYRFDIVEVVVGKNGQADCTIIADAFTPSDHVLR